MKPIFHKNSQQQLNSLHHSIIMNTHGMNHQQQLLITTTTTTTTTTIHQDFIKNPAITTSYFTNFEQHTKYPHVYILRM